jgi:hypothetical protein
MDARKTLLELNQQDAKAARNPELILGSFSPGSWLA